MIAGEHLPRRSPGRRLAVLLLLATAAAAACGVGRPRTVTLIPSAPGPADSGVQLSEDGQLANLAEDKQRVVRFHESGQWERQITAICDEARTQLESDLATVPRPAIVFDIDDTAFSTFAIQRRLGFGWMPSEWDAWVRTSVAPPHPGVLALYRYAVDHGVAVFFITGRRAQLREATERQLRAAGYDRWVGLHLKPDDYAKASVVPYKSSARRAIEQQNFEILINVGDQWSDLRGGSSRATYKLPNPMYYRP